jgi:membrane associated rhomboid family serine protease
VARPAGQRRNAQARRRRRWPRLPYATFALGLLLILGYLISLAHPGGVAGAIAQWGESPVLIAGGGKIPGTLLPAWVGGLTHIFLHARPTHLLANLSLLLLVGAVVEDRLGAGSLLVIFFGSTFAASAVCMIVMWQNQLTVCGASGAVSGVLCAWFVLLSFNRDSFITGYWPDSNWAVGASLLETALRIGLAAAIGFSWLAQPVLLLATGNWQMLRASHTGLAHCAGFLAGGVLALLVIGYCALRWRIHWYRCAQHDSMPRTWDEYVARIHSEADAQPDED